MKTIKNILAFVITILVIVSCNHNKNQVTNQEDYNKYLQKENRSADFASEEIDFWQKKYDKAPNQMAYLSQIASNYSTLFEQTGNIKYLHKAEELLLKSNEAYQYTGVGTVRSLARNYISQHRFKEALVLANKALANGEGLRETHKLLFDVQMELGNDEAAKQSLDYLRNWNNFDYLIRIAKWNDHIGDLKTAISLMERAKIQAEQNNDVTLKVWIYSNLGDMNGHAGNIKESYKYYLKALEIEPNHSYSLKGIAWILFSHEKNTKEANRIIDVISKKHNSPDFYLIKSEIAEYENNTQLKEENLNAYFSMLNQNEYGAMYNKYNALIYADHKKTAQKALEIALIEVNHRPTPDSYDLLAWSYYSLGDYKKSLEIAQKHVAGKSFEPQLNYHLALIYKANKMDNMMKPLKQDLLASTFELGPGFQQKIENL
jgi:hypothetical protein